eukprot:gene6015-6253_t
MSNVIVGAFGGDTIALGSLDMKSGALQLSRFSKAAGPAASFFAWLSNQQQTSVLNVLAANEAGPASAVTAVQLQGLQTPLSAAGTDKKTAGALTAVQMMTLPADSPCHVAIHSSGKWAFSASYPAGTVTVMEVITISGLFPSSAAPAGGGATTAQVSRLLLRKAATLPTQLVGQAAHQVALAGPGDLFVYVPCLKSNWVRMFKGKCGGINSIVIYAVAPSSGALQALAWEDAGGDINFPRHISLTPDKDNSFLLVANQEGGTLTVLRRDATTGLLIKVATVPAASADGSARVLEPAFISVVP